MMLATRKRLARVRRHRRVRAKVRGAAERPRLAVYRSNRHIYAQRVDDDAARTVAAASSVESDVREAAGDKKETAKAVGRLIAQRAKAAGVDRAVFDRGGRLYHGRVASLAEGAREGGLQL
jgi:large subunit ribosomal protein L18